MIKRGDILGDMKKIAVIIYGAPGAGKGTQANLLANAKHLIHFDTGVYLEHFLHDPDNQKSKTVKNERSLFDKGILCSPPFVLDLIKKKARQMAEAGLGIVFSGSPRTVYEVYGDGKTEGLMPELEKLYGKKNIYIFSLITKPRDSMDRNSRRLVCSECGLQVMGIRQKMKECSFCGGKLVKRISDKPEIIKVRLEEYKNRTKPIEKELKNHGYKINRIDGIELPYLVHKEIMSHIV